MTLFGFGFGLGGGRGVSVLDASVLSLAPQSDRGSSGTDGITNETEPVFIFTFVAGAQTGDTLHFYQKTGAGSFSDVAQVVLTSGMLAGTDPVVLGLLALSDNDYEFKYTIENAAGESADSNTVSLTVDTGLGTLTASVTDTDMTVGLGSATVSAGDSIELRDTADGTLYLTYTVLAGDVSGNEATIDLSSLPNGDYDVQVSLYDASDNMSAPVNATFTLFWRLLIHDQFAALGAATALAGWTPDTLNTPGNDWTNAGGDLEGDGSGNVVLSTDGLDAGTIDTGITSNVMRVEATVTCQTDKEDVYVGILGTSGFSGFGGQDAVYLHHTPGDTLELRHDGTTLIDSASVSRTVGVANTYRLQYDGTDLKVFVDDTEITDLRQEGFTVLANQAGQSHALFALTDVSDGAELSDFKAYGDGS